MGPQFRETAYISEVNEAKKVKSYAQVAKNKNSDPMQKLFPWGRPGRTVPQLQFFQTSGIFRNESSHRYPRNRQQFGFSGYLWISVSKLTNNTHVTFGYSHLVMSFLYLLLSSLFLCYLHFVCELTCSYDFRDKQGVLIVNGGGTCRGATLHQKVVVRGFGDIYRARGARAYNGGLRQSHQRDPGAKPLLGVRGEAP